MPEHIACRFFGGHHDGRVLSVHHTLLTTSGVVLLPIWVERHTSPDFVFVDEFYETEMYRWDGTLTEFGERRMRWQP